MKEADNDVSTFGTNTKVEDNNKTIDGGKGNCDPLEKVPNDEVVKKDYVRWNKMGGKRYLGCGETVDTLEAGYYKINQTDMGIVFTKEELIVDELIKFPDSVMNVVLNEVEMFWDKGSIYKHYNFLHRRGYLFWGPPGSGKTCLVHLLINDIIDRGGIVVSGSLSPRILNKALSILREVEPERQLICLFEDMDSIIREHGEDEILSVLDGENQVDKVLNIATTNYPEKLDARIIARPRRFDRVIKIAMPSDKIRREYFTKKLGLKDEDNVEEYVKLSDGFSFASLAELVISTKCFDIPLVDAAEKLEKLKPKNAKKQSSESYYETEGAFGFGSNGQDKN